MIKEGQDDGRIQVCQLKAFRRLADVLLRKLQEQTEAVAVGRHGLRAGIALGKESFQEERLQDGGGTASGGGGLHNAPPSPCGAKRSAARARSSGTAVMYQYLSETLA